MTQENIRPPDRDKPTLGKRSGNPAIRTDTVMGRADRLDERRRKQIQNQIDIINRMKKDLEDLKHEVWGQSIIMYCLLKQVLAANPGLDGEEIAIRKSEMNEAPGGSVASRLDAEGNIYIKINNTKESS